VTPEEYARHSKRIVVSDRGCWAWQGAILKPTKKGNGGYAIANVGGKATLLHREMYKHLVGPIPDGFTLDHRCRIRACLNPAHLEPVSSQTNTLRGIGPTAVNAEKTECPKGHPYSGANLYTDKTGRRHCRECRRNRTRDWLENRGGREWHRQNRRN
jgi:hypothetical protein